MDEPMLAFYRRHGVSPVRQDVGDQRHFERRRSLYLHLGLAPRFVRGAKVLEVGPGSGHNALFTASLAPADYLLVDGNPKGVADIEALFSTRPALQERVRVKNQSLAQFAASNTEQFDLVLCEGMMGGLADPLAAVVALEASVAPGGVLVVTTMDTLSMFAEVVRRMLAYLVLDRTAPLPQQVNQLMPLLEPHLRALPGMSRRHDDWIVDNIVQPITSGYNCLSIPDVITALEPTCDYLAGSPRMVLDWRWYKDLHGNQADMAVNAIQQYWSHAHNLMDYRMVAPPRSAEANRWLAEACGKFREMVIGFEEGSAVADESIVDCLKAIANTVSEFSEETATALSEAGQLFAVVRDDAGSMARSQSFSRLFGRTQQYVSFVKRSQIQP